MFQGKCSNWEEKQRLVNKNFYVILFNFFYIIMVKKYYNCEDFLLIWKINYCFNFRMKFFVFSFLKKIYGLNLEIFL